MIYLSDTFQRPGPAWPGADTPYGATPAPQLGGTQDSSPSIAQLLALLRETSPQASAASARGVWPNFNDAAQCLLTGVHLPGGADAWRSTIGAPQRGYYDDRQGVPRALQWPPVDYSADPNILVPDPRIFDTDPNMQTVPPQPSPSLKDWRGPRNDPYILRPGWKEAASG